mmetsp:Transcript_8509/g.10216  ORF Transcript_8509/g.10216 Transcript_8509/m.10216 type:complete len:409 (-) Transcript_8509:415-1641(-)
MATQGGQMQPGSPMGPANALSQYKAYVRANPAQIKRAEEMGRLGAMLLPVGRLGEYSELINELFYAILGLVGAFHDHLIHGQEQARLSFHRLRVLLNLLSHTEVVLEMACSHFGGEANHQKFIYSLECFKAIVRLMILSKTSKNTILMNGGQYDAKAHLPLAPPPGQQPTSSQTGASVETSDSNSTENIENQEIAEQKQNENPRWIGKRSGKVLQLSQSLKEYDNAGGAETSSGSGNSKPLATRANARAVDLEGENMLRMFGEVLNILRPVIYLSQLRRGDRKRWSPWLISLFIDLLSFRVSSVAIAPQVAPENCKTPLECALKKFMLGPGALSNDEDTKKAVAELGRRRLLVLFYLMRSPVYDNYTLAFVHSIRSGLEKLPALGAIGGMIEETLQYYHRTHFYISAS